MAKLRSDEEVLTDAMNIFKVDSQVESNSSDNLDQSVETSNVMGEDRPQEAEVIKQDSTTKRRHMGEVQRLRIANEQAEQRAMQKNLEAEELRRELEVHKAHNSQLINHAQELKESYADGILEASEQELVTALENGDSGRIAELFAKQREITKIMVKQAAEQVARDNAPKYPYEYQPREYEYERNSPQPQYDTSQENPNYLSWLDKTDQQGNRINAWADPYDEMNYSQELVNEALEYATELNKVLKKRGIGHHIGTIEYYDILSNAIDEKHGLSQNQEPEELQESQPPRQPSRPTSYAPVNSGMGSGGSYIAPKQGSIYKLNPEISSFISKLPMLNTNMTDEQKYEVFMKLYDQEQKNPKRKQ